MSSGFMGSVNLRLSKAERLKALNAKKAKAEKIIRLHVTGAFTVGFCPIPFSDMPILLANQVALVDNVVNIYEREELKELLSILLSQIGLGVFVTLRHTRCGLFNRSVVKASAMFGYGGRRDYKRDGCRSHNI